METNAQVLSQAYSGLLREVKSLNSIQGLSATIYTQTNQFHVILEVGPSFQQDAGAFSSMYVPIGSASANLASTIALAGTNSALTGAAALAP